MNTIKTLFVILFLSMGLAAQSFTFTSPWTGYHSFADQVGAAGMPAQADNTLSCCGVQNIVASRYSGAPSTFCYGSRNNFYIGNIAQFGTVTPWSNLTQGTYTPFFIISAFPVQTLGCLPAYPSITVPGAKVGFDKLFMPSDIIVAPSHVAPYVALGTYDLFWYEFAVPNNISLYGSFLSSQAFRFDPNDGLIYLSNRVDVNIL